MVTGQLLPTQADKRLLRGGIYHARHVSSQPASSLALRFSVLGLFWYYDHAWYVSACLGMSSQSLVQHELGKATYDSACHMLTSLRGLRAVILQQVKPSITCGSKHLKR